LGNFTRKFKHSKTESRKCWYSNSCISFWWLCWSRFQNATEEYNGATWTSSNPLIIGKTGLTSAGTQTAALAAGGGDTTRLYNINRRI
jgi:hypothetical protein